MNLLFSVLSAAYIAGIFLLADSPVVSDVAPFNPYSLLHIPLYGILTVLLILSFRRKPSNPINPRDPMNPMNSRNSTNSTNPINPINLLAAGIIALVVAIADEIHQAYLPNRDASIIDVFLDIIGIILCMLIIKRIEHMSGFLKLKGLLHRTK